MRTISFQRYWLVVVLVALFALPCATQVEHSRTKIQFQAAGSNTMLCVGYCTVNFGTGISVSQSGNTITITATSGNNGTVNNCATANAIAYYSSTGTAVNCDGSVTLVAGALSLGTLNGLTPTALTTGFSIAGGTTSKTLTVSNTLTLAGTDGTTLTGPNVSGSLVIAGDGTLLSATPSTAGALARASSAGGTVYANTANGSATPGFTTTLTLGVPSGGGSPLT